MRHLIHVVISILMWCLFGYYWYVVSGREIGNDTRQALFVLGIVIAVGLILTLWWVAHNKRLARRNRRSSAPPVKPEPFDQDNLGRPIVADGREILRAATIIDIHVERGPDDDAEDPYGGRKVYSVPTGPEVV